MQPTCPWGGYPPGTISFCEERLCAWVVEPSNAYSNVAYVLVGLSIIWQLRGRPRTALPIFGVSGVLVGLGSFLFHGTGTRWAELLDLAGMYLISGLGLTFALKRLLGFGERAAVGFYAALVALSMAQMMALHNSGIVMFAVQLAVTAAAEVMLRRTRPAPSYRPIYAALGCFGLAYGVWNLDYWKVLCDPRNHLVTGHAVWHALTALALYFLYRHQRQLAPG